MTAGMSLRMPNGTSLPTMGRVILPITILGQTYDVEAHVVHTLPTELIVGLPAMSRMGAVIDTSELAIRLKNDPHRSLKIQLEPGASQEVYTVLQDIQLPAHTESLVPVSSKVLGLSNKIPSGEWREVTPYHATERYKKLLVAPGITNVPVQRLLVANLAPHNVRLTRGTRLATAKQVSQADLQTIQTRPSGLYDEYAYEFPPQTQRNSKQVDMQQVCTELQIQKLQTQLTWHQNTKLMSLLYKYTDLWSTADMPLQRTTAAEHEIHTGTSRPVAQPPRQTGLQQKREIQKQIKEMINDDIIRESQSPWAAPIVLVRKKDGSVRFCVDYRKLNQVTTRDHYPLPRTEDILDTLNGSQYFTTLDLRSGYWQVPVREEDKKKTAFVFSAGLYEYNVMPFGLTNAPATFQRLMDAVLAGLRWKSCLVYLDDIIIFSPDFATHIQRLDEVFARLRQHNLVLKPVKCEMLRKQVAYLCWFKSSNGGRGVRVVDGSPSVSRLSGGWRRFSSSSESGAGTSRFPLVTAWRRWTFVDVLLSLREEGAASFTAQRMDARPSMVSSSRGRSVVSSDIL